MAPAMHGLAAAQPDRTLILVDPTPVAKWCASSFSSQKHPLLPADDAVADDRPDDEQVQGPLAGLAQGSKNWLAPRFIACQEPVLTEPIRPGPAQLCVQPPYALRGDGEGFDLPVWTVSAFTHHMEREIPGRGMRERPKREAGMQS